MSSLIKPLRFRFTHLEDVEKYGDGWHVYDESEWTKLPARTLMRYEQEIGIPLADVMTGVRQSSAFGDMAATWLALKLEDKAPAFSDYNPIVMTIEWEPVPAAELEPGKEGAEPEDSRDSELDPPPDASDSPATSEMAMVSLPSMPISA